MDTVATVTVYLGARPNTPKVWTLQRAVGKLRTPGPAWSYVHTGQHYDPRLGAGLCEELELRVDRWLRCGEAATDAEQLGRLCTLVEQDLDRHPAGAVVVVGDVNTTVAAALVAARRGTPVIHLEAGLRSPDRTPEEANRRIVTACADHHLATTAEAVAALRAEGVPDAQVHWVGNPMAECHLAHDDPAADAAVLDRLGLTAGRYVLATLHKPPRSATPNRCWTCCATSPRRACRPSCRCTRGPRRTWSTAACSTRASPSGCCRRSRTGRSARCCATARSW